MSKQDPFPVGLVNRSQSTVPVVMPMDARTRCERHGMLLVSGAQCMRCVKEDSAGQTRRTLTVVAIVAACILLTLVGARAIAIGRELGAASSAMAEAPTSDGRLVVYTTSFCPYCRKAKAWFDDRQIAYVERNVDFDTSARDEWNALGGRSVPLIAIDGQVVQRGFDPSGQNMTKILIDHGIDPGMPQ